MLAKLIKREEAQVNKIKNVKEGVATTNSNKSQWITTENFENLYPRELKHLDKMGKFLGKYYLPN